MPRRVRELEPRHRFLPAGRGRLAARPDAPDGLYGLSAFGENLAQLYWDRYGIETVSLRIGSAFAAPKDRRMLATWMSFDDTERLVVAALTAPVVGHTVIYGMSDNASTWWDNTPRAVGLPATQDSSDRFPCRSRGAPAGARPRRPTVICQGGAFVRTGPARRSRATARTPTTR